MRSSDSPAEACNDSQLVSRVCAGETGLFAELMRRHQDAVYGMALRFLRSPGEAEEVAQEVFLRVFRGLPEFRNGSTVSTWLYRITFNLCTDRMRREQRHGLPRAGTIQPDQVADTRMEPGARLQAASERQEIREAVQRLPQIYRTVITLHYYQGLSREEVSAATGLPLKTVETRLYRARKMLRSAELSRSAGAQLSS